MGDAKLTSYMSVKYDFRLLNQLIKDGWNLAEVKPNSEGLVMFLERRVR